MLSKEELISEMKKKGIRPYHKRIRIYEYLLSCCAHPTADEIFFALRQQDLPGLSKTTVYNVLKLFADAELMGIPYRLTVSDRLVEQNKLELTKRLDGQTSLLTASEVLAILD